MTTNKTLNVIQLLLMALTITSCNAEIVPEQKLANPAVAKCLSDGWKTEPLLVNGVPTDTICINPATGQRCPAWSYFRGECPAIKNHSSSAISK